MTQANNQENVVESRCGEMKRKRKSKYVQRNKSDVYTIKSDVFDKKKISS